ncbi:hypothetical protein BDR06DRAFT_980193 [Suillus hirtellus]|nr:hypothetical protein BDR06DRAFT_980193 [Suillus hirtellus]
MAALLAKQNDSPPFADHKDLHKVIDATQLGDVPWQGFLVQYLGEHPEDAPSWMDDEYDVWYRDPCLMAHNMLANPTYTNEIDYTPFHEYDAANNTRRWKDFMSGDWAWQQADEILKDPNTHGSAFIPIILGSDKTTVSVGTGNNEYYPLYASIGNVHNNVQCAHHDALIVIGSLAIPKTNRKDAKEDIFRNFCHQLFHHLLSAILASLRPGMTEYKVLRCRDGHFRRVIYGLGPYIADYEEQLVLSCTIKNWCPNHPFMNDFPHADIHQLLSFDLLHQLIKGTFKDHLVDWVVKYLRITHVRVAAAPSFPGLQQFHEGCDFRQWTGNDSKALMKVFIPAIEGHVPQDIVHAFCALLEFCFLVWHNIITEDTINQIEDALACFHRYHQIFETLGMVSHFSLPRQHSMVHYVDMIQLFTAPNGLCSSITESKHIKSVKDPWRWSSKNNALGQMLLCNQHLDNVAKLAEEVDLFPDDPRNPEDVPAATCPRHTGKLYVFISATATFYAPSDPSSVGGMQCEQIHACPLWQNVYPCNDCVFISTDMDLEGMVKCFFSFKYLGKKYPCVLIQWFDKIGDCPDKDTGMWMVWPGVLEDGSPNLSVIHIDTVYRAAHLMPVYGPNFIPHTLKFYHSYDAFRSFYVNRYADHHAFEIAS